MAVLRDAAAEGKIGSLRNLERPILYRLRTSTPEELHDVAEVAQGLEYRLYKAKRAASLEELMAHLQTKRYPMARLRRILLHMLLGICNEDMQKIPPYGRILAFNDVGRQILHDSKTSICCRSPIRWRSFPRAAPMHTAAPSWMRGQRIFTSSPPGHRTGKPISAGKRQCSRGRTIGLKQKECKKSR